MEFAVVAPILFTVILGVIEIGREFMVAHAMASAASHACRRAVVKPLTADAVATDVDNSLAAWGIHGQTTSVKVNGVVADPSTAVSGDEITVTVSIPVASITVVPGATALGNISRKYTLRKE